MPKTGQGPKKTFMILLVLLCSPLLMGGIVEHNVTTGDDELILISTEKERKIGQSVSRQIAKKYKSVNDPLIQQRFEEIGKKIESVCDRTDFIYHFDVLEGDEYNAFSVPGGYIYIFKKLYDEFKSDDELAAVIAHEVGHVAARHSVKRLQSSMALSLLGIVGTIAAEDRRDVMYADFAFAHLMTSYARDDELLADKLSVKYVTAAGFDPKGVLLSLEKLQDINMNGPIRNFVYFKTHPYISIRISHVEQELSGKMDFKSYINQPSDSGRFVP